VGSSSPAAAVHFLLHAAPEGWFQSAQTANVVSWVLSSFSDSDVGRQAPSPRRARIVIVPAAAPPVRVALGPLAVRSTEAPDPTGYERTIEARTKIRPARSTRRV
jgi:hypothetical protein